MADERMGNHMVHVNYNPERCTIIIEILGLDDSDNCSAYIYNLTGQVIQNQDVVVSPTEIGLYSNNSGVYILRLALNGENRCWKIIKK